jgi:catechol 2,3-dioxygenase-like lactoylglutathione lyase family enzyme
MTGTLIDHIGILVPDLEKAIERWSTATGSTFSPIARSRTDRFRDTADPATGRDDVRQGGRP